MAAKKQEWVCHQCGQTLTTYRPIIGQPVHTCKARPGKRTWTLEPVGE